MSDTFTILAIPDVHFDEHDPVALAALAQIAKKTPKIDAIVQLGDLCDHIAVSRFAQGRPKDQSRRLMSEWMPAAKWITEIKEAARCDNYWQLEGNHETRLRRFLDHNPALEGIFYIHDFLGVDKSRYVESDEKGHVLRFEWQAGRIMPIVRDPEKTQSVLFQGVSFLHSFRHGMHHAKANAEALPWPGPIVCGDSHDQQTYTAQRWGRDQPTCHTFGFLGRPEHWRRGRPSRTSQGFGIIRLALNVPGLYQAHAYRIYDGKCIGPDGKVYG